MGFRALLVNVRTCSQRQMAHHLSISGHIHTIAMHDTRTAPGQAVCCHRQKESMDRLSMGRVYATNGVTIGGCARLSMVRA
jgi:hypothetical protein